MQIDFYVYNPHEVVLWEPIWRALRDRGVDAAFIVEPPGICTATGSVSDRTRGYHDDKSGETQPLMTAGNHQAILELLEGLGCPHEERSRLEAEGVVTTQSTGWLWRYRGAKLRTMYGVGATRDSYGHGPVNQGFDGVFAHGEISRVAIAEQVGEDRVQACGFPKYAPFFRGEVDVEEWRKRLALDRTKRTLVYLPTWAHNSSLGRYPEALARLAGEFNILCKPHHNNLHLERERLDPLLRAPGVTVCTDVPNIVPFLACADAVLADVRSGAFPEALLLDRPTVGLSPAGDAAADNLIPEAFEAAAVCASHEELEPLVRAALAEDPYREGRRRLAARLFSSHDGQDDAVTAEAMIECARRSAPAAFVREGEALFGYGDLAGARRLFRKALRLAPSNATAWNNLGVASLALGDTSRAVEAFNKAIAVDSSHVDALINLAQLLFYTGDPSGADDTLQRARSLAPDDARVGELRSQFAAEPIPA